MREVGKKFFADFQILGPLGCQGWVVIPQNVKKSLHPKSIDGFFIISSIAGGIFIFTFLNPDRAISLNPYP